VYLNGIRVSNSCIMFMSKYCKIIQSRPIYEQDLIPTAQYPQGYSIYRGGR